jgi:ubiquinone/menaquinone biosynthesis C-methylase UbiE
MITSFGAMFQNSYDHDIRDFWHQQLDVDCKNIVDLACGNGALVWIADEIRNPSGKKRTHITGVDIANIKPFKILGKKAKRYPMIKFIANTSIDDLPFDDGSIDIVISQYGLEYSILDTTIPEIARVLTANGKMCFVMHDEYSAIIQKEKLVIAECLRVLEQEKIEHDYLALDESYNAYAGVDAANDPELKR